MRYRDLQIATQRETPSDARTVGLAFLLRAGFKTRDGGETALGQQALTRLQDRANGPGDFLVECGLPIVKGDAGESFFAIPSGTIEIFQCGACGYAARSETARIKKQAALEETPLPIEKIQTPACDTIDSVARFLGIPREKTAKAMMYTRAVDGKFVFVAVRGDMQVSEAKLKKLTGDLRAATPAQIMKAGAVAGYASPIGLTDALVIADDLIPQSANLTAGANEEGYHLKNTNYGRDYRADIISDLVRARVGDPCPDCGSPLAAWDAEVVADKTGYRFGNILAALAEVHHDDKGLTLPAFAAPFDAHLLQLPGKLDDTRARAEDLYGRLQSAGLSVLFDDRDVRAGVKFIDADLIGCPIRVTVGEKTLKEGMVELKPRTSLETQLVPFTSVVSSLQSYFNS
jgi:prolyl-tRNA synthetase